LVIVNDCQSVVLGMETGRKSNCPREGTTLTVADRFNTLLSRIAMSTRDVLAFETHRQTVSAALKSEFRVNRIEKMGSFSRGSALSTTRSLCLQT
jgi:hypothetical protein